jgi:hypothetical protein
MSKAHIEITIPNQAHLKMDINDLFDVYLAMMFLTTYFIEEKHCAHVNEEAKADAEG